MQHEMQVLLLAAITISCLHTLTGPDHYLPFLALSKSRGWSLRRTIGWTLVCGCGHVCSSVVLGGIGAAIGWSLSSMNFFQSVRGSMAAWCMLAFGFLYVAWGFLRVWRNRPHKHFEIRDDDILVFEHRHGASVRYQERHRVTPWVLFLIFVLGPCEPMLPLMYFPAAQSSLPGMIALIGVYTFFTLLSMLVMVCFGYYGLRFLPANRIERYVPLLGGGTLALTGAGMIFLNW